MAESNAPDTHGSTDVMEQTDLSVSIDHPWQVLLYNDPVNTTAFVTLTLMRVIKVDAEAAERLMLLAHTNGKTSVSTGAKAQCQQVATALMAAKLWATLEKVS